MRVEFGICVKEIPFLSFPSEFCLSGVTAGCGHALPRIAVLQQSCKCIGELFGVRRIDENAAAISVKYGSNLNSEVRPNER